MSAVVFTARGMTADGHDRTGDVARRLAIEAGSEIRDERVRRRWTIRELARRSGLSLSEIHRLESGQPGSLASYARVANALALRPELHLVDGRRIQAARAEDPVHAWMGDAEAALLQGFGFTIALDEPFQHYQFAGRADLLAWSIEKRALLHIENRTRFPNLQEAFGSYNAKRAYLAPAIADRVKLHGGFTSVTHAIVALWSAEVLHTLRLRTASFRATCPDPVEPFLRWWAGDPPSANASAFVLLDPIQRPRHRRVVGLDGALRAEPRYRGYAEALEAMRRGNPPGGR